MAAFIMTLGVFTSRENQTYFATEGTNALSMMALSNPVYAAYIPGKDHSDQNQTFERFQYTIASRSSNNPFFLHQKTNSSDKF